MKRPLAAAFFILLLLSSFSYAEIGNQGVIFSKTASPQKQNLARNAAVETPMTTSGNFAEREIWRSGVAGTFAMWRQLIANALPSGEAFPADPKTKKQAVNR